MERNLLWGCELAGPSKKAPAKRPRRPAVPPTPLTVAGRVDQLLESLRQAGPLDTQDELLGQQATQLARALDDLANECPPEFRASRASAAATVNRELRATVDGLMKGRDVDDDDEFFARMPTAVWDTKKPGSPDAR